MMLRGKIRSSNSEFDLEFKVDTGFDGECVLSYEIFESIESLGGIFDGPYVRLVNGQYVPTRSKLVSIQISGKPFVALCISNPYFSRNLIGEGLLKRIQAVIDYKSGSVKDP